MSQNNLNKNVRHLGKIISITPNVISVKIENTSLCSSCHAKGACTAADKADKIIDVENLGKGDFNVGESVYVTMQKSMGLRAVFISYVIPLFILLILLLTLPTLHFSELAAGLCALLGVGLYYGVIYLFRKRVANDFVFKIEKQ